MNSRNTLENESTSSEHGLIKTINRLMLKAGINETQLAKNCGLPQPTLNRILSGKTPDPRLSTLAKIAEYFELSTGQLLSDEPNEETIVIKAQRITHVPIISWSDAIKGAPYISTLSYDNWHDWAATEVKLSNSSFALQTKASLEPRFPKNSLLLIDPNCHPSDSDLVIISFKNSEEAALRELLIDGPLKQLKNVVPQTTTPVSFDVKEHTIIGVVVQIKFQTK